MTDRGELLRAGALQRKKLLREQIKNIEQEIGELDAIIGGCRKSEHCWQHDGHAGGCSDIRHG